MHLDHKIPWNQAAAQFDLKRCNRSVTPNRTDLFACDKSWEPAGLHHFRRVLIGTIRDFSTTEATIPRSPIPPNNLFNGTLLSYAERRYGLGSHQTNSVLHNPLFTDCKDIQYWIHRAGTDQVAYSSGDGDLSDAVKMLIIIAAGADSEDTAAKVMSKQAVSVLLTLSRHPNVPVHTLANIHWGHGFGVSLVASSALEAYLLINLFDAVLSRKRLKLGVSTEKEVSLLETRCFQNFASKALSDYDYPAQNIIHRAFWNKMGVTDSWTYEQEKKGWAESGEQDIKGVIDPLRGENEKARLSLQRYLKSCFAILYIYDLLLREWHGDDGADQTWVSWIDYFFESFGHKR